MGLFEMLCSIACHSRIRGLHGHLRKRVSEFNHSIEGSCLQYVPVVLPAYFLALVLQSIQMYNLGLPSTCQRMKADLCHELGILRVQEFL